MRNEYKIVSDTAVIYLNHRGKQLETIIDLSDFEKANSVTTSWGARYDPDINNYYVQTTLKENGKNVLIQLHRFLCDAPKGMVVDHINRDSLDNRRSRNLRVVTDAQNKQNTRRRKNGSSKYRGVSKNKETGKWIARIKVNGKMIYLGTYGTEIEAAKVAREARLKYFTHSVEDEIII
ncbi:AP2 domain-containing protein [Paenibacillus taiwanensis]|uniref:AP2 domain-containing protein n=1 Tax=Paenibacillus taiwanensis TaxID=401638 RepID=UPI000420F8FD|nr:AP2 domain-containing protein [Paenibacillus taiwanensis]